MKFCVEDGLCRLILMVSAGDILSFFYCSQTVIKGVALSKEERGGGGGGVGGVGGGGGGKGCGPLAEGEKRQAV